MRALAMHQPWATRVAIGEKEYETRSRSTPYRGPLAIHATKNAEYVGYGSAESDWPRGALVAVCRLVSVHRTDDLCPSEAERRLGDWTPGRFAWRLADVQRLAEPIPIRGYQSLWRLRPDIIALIAAQLAEMRRGAYAQAKAGSS